MFGHTLFFGISYLYITLSHLLLPTLYTMFLDMGLFYFYSYFISCVVLQNLVKSKLHKINNKCITYTNVGRIGSLYVFELKDGLEFLACWLESFHGRKGVAK